MKPAKKSLFPAIAFILAFGLALSAYFLFWKKSEKPRQEILLEKSPPANSTADTPDSTKEEETEEDAGPPIPYVVRTEAVDKISDSVELIHKKHFLPSAPDCENYSFEWTEIKLRDKRIEDRINRSIVEEVNAWREEENGKPEVPAQFCNSESSKEFVENLTVFGTLAHANYHLSEYFAGGAHPNIMFKTTCYSLKTGKIVNFHDLIKPEKIAELDSLIVQSTGDEEGPHNTVLRQTYREQLPDLNFMFEESGLQVIRRGFSYVTSIMPLDLDMAQTDAFLKPEVYKMVYGRNKTGQP